MTSILEELQNLQVTEPIFKEIKFFISGDVDDKVSELLKNGGAERSNYFSDYVTHLICGENPEESDLTDANDLYEIPALSFKWVYMCVKVRKLVGFGAFKFNNEKLFSKMVFSFSKIENDKIPLWAILTYHGGIVKAKLDNTCTHLVTACLDSPKYLKASMLNTINIITPDWIMESLKAKQIVQTELYHPKLIQWPKLNKHESTALITGFEQDENEKQADTSTADSTQALLEKLKQRMPWNQPQTNSTEKADILKRLEPPPRFPAPQVRPQQSQLYISQQQQPQPQQQANQLSGSIMQRIMNHNQQQQLLLNQQQQHQQILTQQQNQLLQQQQQQHALSQLQQQQQQQSSISQHLGQINQQPQVNSSQANQIVQQQHVNNQLMQQQQQQQHVLVSQQLTLNQHPNQIIQQHASNQPVNQLIQQQQMQHPQNNQLLQQQHVSNQLLQQQQHGLNNVQVQRDILQQQLSVGNQQVQQQQQQHIGNQLLQQQHSGNQQQTRDILQQQLTSNPQQSQILQHQLVNSQQNNQLLQQQQQQNQLLQQHGEGLPANQLIQQQPNQLLQQQQQQTTQMLQQQTNQLIQQQQPNQMIQQQQQSQLLQQQQPNQLLQQQTNQLIQQQQPNQIIQQQQQPNQLIQQQQQQSRLLQQQQQQPNQLLQQQQVNNPLIQQQNQILQQQQQVNQQQQAPNLVMQQLNQQKQIHMPQQQQPVSQYAQPVNRMAFQNQTGQFVNQQQQHQIQHFQQQQQQQQQGNFPNPPVVQQFGQQQQQPAQPGTNHWQQQIRSQINPRISWSPTSQNPNMPQRQLIQLDAQTHQQLQQMDPQQRALFVAKLQKRQQLIMQQQLQAQRAGGHILIRGGPPPGLNPQQRLQWIQQQKQQVVLQQQQQQVNQQQQQQQQQANQQQQQVVQQATQVAQPGQATAPGLSPLIQNQQPFSEQQLQLQRQLRLQQQLQLQREQQLQQQAAQQQQQVVQQQQQQQGNVVRPMAQQPQPPDAIAANPAVAAAVAPDSNAPQPQLVATKTKTALANMLNIRLQSGAGPQIPPEEQPSAAGTLRLMTAQHNAALNAPPARPQDLLALQQQQRRTLGNLTNTNGELARPQNSPSVPPSPPKLQHSPNICRVIPMQHRAGPFYGHNPNLKLPPDLFLLGCIFVVVEVERFMKESLPDFATKIEQHGGELEPVYCSRVTHVLCETQRHGVVMQALRDSKRCVTLYWLSDVINRKQVLPPWQALHLPTVYVDGTPGAKHLISLSGFVGTERNRVRTMITYTGAKYTNYFSKHNTLLVCAKAEGKKHQHAKKWGTPVVNVQWITDVMLGHFSALNQMDNAKYQQFASPAVFTFDPILVPTLMHAWKAPINISQESYERVKRSPSPVVFPKKPSKKPKLEDTSEAATTMQSQNPNATHRILFSMVSEPENMKQIVYKLGGTMAASHKDATHLVMPSLARTNKLLFCLCTGTHIVPESWLKESQTAEKFVEESSYLIDTKLFNSTYACELALIPRKARSKLFENKFFFVTPSVFPKKSQLCEMIQLCGGIVEKQRRTLAQIEATNISNPSSYFIITHENDLHLVGDCLKNGKAKLKVVCNSELILSAILKQTFEVDPYIVQVQN